MKWSLVVPCYNEENNVRRFMEICREAIGDSMSYEVVFVNDGSRDNTWQKLKALHEAYPQCVKLINFARNFGKEAAMYAGLQRAEGDYVTVIDADLQQRPEIALDMVRFLDANPDYDCVAAYQDTRRENKFISLCKKMFYKLINAACEIDFKAGASDFRTMRKTMVEAVLSMREYHRFSKGIFAWVGFNTHYVPYVADERLSGKSTWSFKKLCKYAFDGIISFTIFPLHIATVVGTVMSIGALLYGIVVLVQKLAFGIDVPGYTTIVLLILLIGGLQMIMLGIIGEYIARIYIQGKHRPVFVAKEYIDSKTEE
ncbi:MAG: glycosyltransferase family 2 protein [Clostridia bacterium]|nr:glycosyltransferase family 2 protein [Clostridia bacterium]